MTADALLPVADELPSIRGIDVESLLGIRSDMFRFARLQVGNPELAEDLVQESIEAALRSSASFAGKSTLKTWIFAILKNRIIDHLRQAKRTVTFSCLVEEGEEWQERLESLFNEQGRWRAEMRPVAWPSPEDAIQSRQFWVIFETCLDQLPSNTAQVFMMREVLGFDTDEVCRQFDISAGNLHVILHRARMKLRICLENGWVRERPQIC